MTTGEFTWRARVYWEDTDGGGVVYYANYLKFMERARTEWLRSRGHLQSELAEEHGFVFAVVEVRLNYRRPARLDDELAISCVPVAQIRATEQGGAGRRRGGTRDAPAAVTRGLVTTAVMRSTLAPEMSAPRLPIRSLSCRRASVFSFSCSCRAFSSGDVPKSVLPSAIAPPSA